MKSIILLALLITIAIPTRSTNSMNDGRTYADVERFIASDTTNQLTYSDTFDCVQFTDTLLRHAREQGFIATAVRVTWVGDPFAHDFTAFYTVDKGIVWIEPEADTEYYQSPVGGQLCDNSGFCWPGITESYKYVYNPY